MFRYMFRDIVEALRVVAAFSEGRGEGCVWRASKDLIFFSSARSESHSEEASLQSRRGMSTEMNRNEFQDMEAIKATFTWWKYASPSYGSSFTLFTRKHASRTRACGLASAFAGSHARSSEERS